MKQQQKYEEHNERTKGRKKENKYVRKIVNNFIFQAKKIAICIKKKYMCFLKRLHRRIFRLQK